MADPLPSGGVFDVELQVPGVLTWGRSVRIWDGADVADVAGTTLRAVVHDIEHDGVLALVVADGLMFVEARGEPPLGVLGATVVLTVADLEAHPYEL